MERRARSQPPLGGSARELGAWEKGPLGGMRLRTGSFLYPHSRSLGWSWGGKAGPLRSQGPGTGRQEAWLQPWLALCPQGREFSAISEPCPDELWIRR